MFKLKSFWQVLVVSAICLSCQIPKISSDIQNATLPTSYKDVTTGASKNSGTINWKTYFKDPNLTSLIDSALVHNQELNIAWQEIEIAHNEIRARRGEYLPFVGLQGSAGLDKLGRYTRLGASEANIQIKPGKTTPEPLTDFLVGPYSSWEIDIWHKYRNAQKSAVNRYMATIEGKNFMVTNLIAEIASAYYELLALDNELDVLKQNIEIQNNALAIVKLEKQAARVTELAVQRFEAQVLNTKSMQFEIEQQIVETENRIHFLIGSYPKPITRNSAAFSKLIPDTLFAGLPAQLLENRPDVKQAELMIKAAKLDIKSAKANFYPSLNLTAGFGLNAFSLTNIIDLPHSLMYSLASGISGPLVNRNAIKSMYLNANAKQIQALYNYQKTLLNAYIEVSNQVSNIKNLDQTYRNKELEVQALNRSVTISTNLFSSARADYMEVLLTQRDALESRFQLLETKQKQLHVTINMYRALGGGWN